MTSALENAFPLFKQFYDTQPSLPYDAEVLNDTKTLSILEQWTEVYLFACLWFLFCNQ